MFCSSTSLRELSWSRPSASDVCWFFFFDSWCVAVALAQGFLYAAVSVAPIMVVIPLLQLSLVFRLFFSMWLNPEHEIFGPRVIIGSVISIAGACAVSVDSDLILAALSVPEAWARLLRWQVN